MLYHLIWVTLEETLVRVDPLSSHPGSFDSRLFETDLDQDIVSFQLVLEACFSWGAWCDHPPWKQSRTTNTTSHSQLLILR